MCVNVNITILLRLEDKQDQQGLFISYNNNNEICCLQQEKNLLPTTTKSVAYNNKKICCLQQQNLLTPTGTTKSVASYNSASQPLPVHQHGTEPNQMTFISSIISTLSS